jgi:hypothetical protein
MTDDQLIDRLKELTEIGHDGVAPMRELLKCEGGMSRVVGILDRLREHQEKPKIRAATPIVRTGEPKGFQEFYDAYPRHDSRATALKAYRTALHLTSAETLLEGAKRYRDYCAREAKEPRFIKLPASWLNAQAWLDESTGRQNGAPVVFEQCSIDQWKSRVQIFAGLVEDCKAGTWTAKWGPAPGQPGCKAPPEALAIMTHVQRQKGNHATAH